MIELNSSQETYAEDFLSQMDNIIWLWWENIHGGRDHELCFVFIISPNLSIMQDKQLRTKTYHIIQQLNIMGSYKIWFTNLSAAGNNIYASVFSRIYFSNFLKKFQKCEMLCSCLEMLYGGKKWGSANSGVGARGVRDVWRW